MPYVPVNGLVIGDRDIVFDTEEGDSEVPAGRGRQREVAAACPEPSDGLDAWAVLAG